MTIRLRLLKTRINFKNVILIFVDVIKINVINTYFASVCHMKGIIHTERVREKAA